MTNDYRVRTCMIGRVIAGKSIEYYIHTRIIAAVVIITVIHPETVQHCDGQIQIYNGSIAKLAGRVTGPRLGQSLIMFFGNHPRSGAYLPVRDDTRE